MQGRLAAILVVSLLLLKVPAFGQEQGGIVGSSVEGLKALGVVFDYDEPPKRIKMTRPKYPKGALKKGIEGRVIVELVIDRTGHVSHTHVLRSIPDLDAAALKCVKAWIYKPGTKGGQPVPTVVAAQVDFRIDDKTGI